MNLSRYLDNRFARNTILTLCILVASSAFYVGVMYFFLVSVPARESPIYWLEPLFFWVIVVICQLLASNLLKRSRPQRLISALGTSILLTIVGALLVTAIVFLVAYLRYPVTR